MTLATRLVTLSMRYQGFQVLAEDQRCWGVGTGKAARLVHRLVGTWPGNNAAQTACGSSINLHGDDEHPGWGALGGRSFPDLTEVPSRYRVCLKCVFADETIQ